MSLCCLQASGEGSAQPVPSQVLKQRELTRFFNVRLRKFPSGSKVRFFFPPDRNEYKQDGFVRSLCLLSSLGLTGSGSGGRKWLTF